MTKARQLSKLLSLGQPLADGLQAADVSGLATVATSGSYTDLLNKPTGTPGSGVTSYNDLTNKPTFATVATTGSYIDLTNKPTIPTVPTLATIATSGSYTDLTDKPTIPTVPTLATVATSGSYADLTNKPTIPTLPTLATVATSGSYADLTNKPTIPTLPTLATVATSGSYADLTNKPTIPRDTNKIQNLGSIVGAVTVNLSLGNTILATITGAVTWTFTNLTSAEVNTVSLILTNPGLGTQSLPANTVFDKNVAPILPTAGKTLLMLETYDNGANWIASQAWRNVA